MIESGADTHISLRAKMASKLWSVELIKTTKRGENQIKIKCQIMDHRRDQVQL
jgi:hypothetical protein